MTKLTVYGGIAKHPLLGDIHGLVRVVCLARNRHAARQMILKAGFQSIALLSPTQSYIERTVVSRGAPPCIWVCSLNLVYLSGDHYKPIFGGGEAHGT